ncbi:hypothetical protein FXF65_34395 [Actinomadura syzygii]|uniref:Uncharacterized protein n=1 Tax=Actinomadura syzygii TaxID=1427538 RepID=A0A5D0TUH5_9ACTN|nr:hypothetical protein FXF65_34395 [Actinomadura syzygii]
MKSRPACRNAQRGAKTHRSPTTVYTKPGISDASGDTRDPATRPIRTAASRISPPPIQRSEPW